MNRASKTGVRIIPAATVLSPAVASNARGIAFMAAGMFLFAAVDTQAKLLTETLHPFQIVWARQSGLLVGVIVLLAIKGFGILRTRNPGLQIARGLLAATSATIFISAIRHVPLADAIAVSFVAPFIVTVAGAVFLGEPVGARRWIAVSIGFIGTLIVLRPGMGVVHPAILLVMVAATCFALRQILSRVVAGTDRVETTVAYTAISASLALTLPLPFVWQSPASGTVIALLFGIAILSAAGEVLVIKALEEAQAVVVAPVMYTLMIWGTMWGWLVFGQLPDAWTWTGASIIIATGIYTLHRERLADRARARSADLISGR
jgi:S-adenosylmethionine uptake transporter